MQEAWDALEFHMGIGAVALRSRVKNTRVAMARSLWCWLVYRGTAMSLPAMGRELDKHHTTILLAIRRIDDNSVNRAWAEAVEAWIHARRKAVPA